MITCVFFSPSYLFPVDAYQLMPGVTWLRARACIRARTRQMGCDVLRYITMTLAAMSMTRITRISVISEWVDGTHSSSKWGCAIHTSKLRNGTLVNTQPLLAVHTRLNRPLTKKIFLENISFSSLHLEVSAPDGMLDGSDFSRVCNDTRNKYHSFTTRT